MQSPSENDKRLSSERTLLGVLPQDPYKEAKIGDSKLRWGSCTPNDNVIFNWRLIKAPMFVIDYVIVHELAHLLESNHTPRFWNIVKAQIADTEKAKEWLKAHGAELEEEL